METPITEECNPITSAIDVASSIDIVRMLYSCDREIFNGWNQYKGLFDADTISAIEKISCLSGEILKNPKDGVIVLSGCGTSGRLAFLTTRNFNEVLENSGKEPCFRYVIAGRDKALFTSQEAPEDDPQCGVEMLKEATHGKKQVLFIGISCGLSAPFVAGQLYYCMENLDVFTPVLLGFNPAHLARNIKIVTWDKTCLEVVNLLKEKVAENKAFILNPVVGPEPITGSSRMKSGTATKILLESIFVSSLDMFLRDKASNIPSLLRAYQDLCDLVYTESSTMSSLVQLAGNSLKAGGSTTYIGWDSLGIVGMIDASECPPTYGCSLSDIRGFINTGYKLLCNKEGDFSHLGKYFRISIEDFQNDIMPNLKESDLVVFLIKDNTSLISDLFSRRACKKACIYIRPQDQSLQIPREMFDVTVILDLSKLNVQESLGSNHYQIWNQLYREMATKWILNATSTGAFIMKGKVYQNMMVDVKVSNNKLFFRSVGIIQRFSNLSKDESQECLLKSIYTTDNLNDEQRSVAKIQDHIFKATSMDKVVPTALVAASLKCGIHEALNLLKEEPMISLAISKIIKQHTE